MAVAATMLACASFFDLRTRTVHDLVWIIFGTMAVLLFIFDMPNGNAIPLYAFSIIITFLFAAVLYKTRIVGQADVFALIVFAAILPLYASNPLLAPERTINSIAPLGVTMNAAFLALFVMVRNALVNISYAKIYGGLFQGFEHEPKIKKAIAFAIGYRTRSCPQFAFPIEQTIGGKKGFNFGVKDVENMDYEAKGKAGWVTTGIPFLLLMFAGFVMYITVGDIVSMIFSLY